MTANGIGKELPVLIEKLPMKGKKHKFSKITFNAYETQRQKLTAHPTSGAVSNITWRGLP